jgi:hypothetical protein
MALPRLLLGGRGCRTRAGFVQGYAASSRDGQPTGRLRKDTAASRAAAGPTEGTVTVRGSRHAGFPAGQWDRSFSRYGTVPPGGLSMIRWHTYSPPDTYDP